MVVLSLFDGISCGRVALERAGIQVDTYLASEIDKYAIQVAQHNYPDTVQLGDVQQVSADKLQRIDLLIGGSPCLPGDTLVMTDFGYKRMEDLYIGEKVLSHDGAFHRISDFLNQGVRQTFSIKTDANMTDNLRATSNHRFLVRELTDTLSEPMWLSIAELAELSKEGKPRYKNCFLGVPKHEAEASSWKQNNPNIQKESGYMLDDADYTWFAIQSILPYRAEPVYDITVEDTHTFVANHCVTHNCQGFSNAGKGKNFDDPRSRLFWEYVRLLEETKPKYFLLENVVMKKEWSDVISDALGVQPIMIDSALVSAAVRKRLYWTNIPNIGQPEDRGITFGDVREHGVPMGPFYYSEKALDWIRRHEARTGKHLRIIQDGDKMQMLEASMYKNYSSQRFFGIEDEFGLRYITVTESERCMGLPDHYTGVCSKTQAYKQLGNGWNVDTIVHIFNHMKGASE